MRSILLLTVSLALVTGCASASKNLTAKKPASPLASAFKSHWDKDGNADPNGQAVPLNANGNANGDDPNAISTSNLHIAGSIVEACNLPRSSANAMFDYDSTQIGTDDKTVLAALAKCLSDGPLKGRAISLVGRADPRGEMEYNMTLGEARADSVKRYLHDMGVQMERVKSTSRGELDATGSDDATWALDRRVDVDLL